MDTKMILLKKPVGVLYNEIMCYQSIIDNLQEREETEQTKQAIELFRNQIKLFEDAIKTIEPNFYRDMENCSNLKQE